MGNTLRSTLGNLCGGQASKDIDGDIYQRPVAKPKKEKKEKKNKKNKKNKQENNGNLEQIEEEKDERNEKPTEQNNANDNRNKEEKRDVKLEIDTQKTPSHNSSTLSSLDQNQLEHNPKDRSVSPTSVDETYIIQTIPEHKQPGVNHGNLSPLTKEVLMQRKSQITEVVVNEEEHNTLDFGRYVFVDPTTGDIQVMRNRSRSLDSLVSMQSSRSSLSRFGSFEFVTDFEINIAEKNQALKMK